MFRFVFVAFGFVFVAFRVVDVAIRVLELEPVGVGAGSNPGACAHARLHAFAVRSPRLLQTFDRERVDHGVTYGLDRMIGARDPGADASRSVASEPSARRFASDGTRVSGGRDAADDAAGGGRRGAARPREYADFIAAMSSGTRSDVRGWGGER